MCRFEDISFFREFDLLRKNSTTVWQWAWQWPLEWQEWILFSSLSFRILLGIQNETNPPPHIQTMISCLFLMAQFVFHFLFDIKLNGLQKGIIFRTILLFRFRVIQFFCRIPHLFSFTCKKIRHFFNNPSVCWYNSTYLGKPRNNLRKLLSQIQWELT